MEEPPGKFKGRFSPDYATVLQRLRKNILNLKTDYESDRKGQKVNVMTVDFSELFLYMFHTRTRRTDHRLIQYLFRKDLKRDYCYTLLPPAITELRLWYERAREISSRFAFSEELEHTPELQKIYKIFQEERCKKGLINLDDEETLKISAMWSEVCKKFDAIDLVSFIAADCGSYDNLLEASHKRLVSLFSEGIIRRPQDIDFLSNRIQDASSDPRIFKNVISGLTGLRSRISDYPKNLVDAEHAAMDYSFNIMIHRHDIMNIFTGSPAPLNVYEDVLIMSEKGLPLVRCPIYLMIRTFCQTALNSYFDAMEFLSSGIVVADDLLECTEFDAFVRKIGEELDKKDLSEKVAFLHHKLLNYQVVFDIFRMNECFSDYFYDALRSHAFDAFSTIKFKDKYYQASPKSLKAMRIIATADRILNDQKNYEELLASTEEKIYENLGETYRFYIKMMEGFDYSKLSPLMRQHYDFALSPPSKSIPRNDINNLILRPK